MSRTECWRGGVQPGEGKREEEMTLTLLFFNDVVTQRDHRYTRTRWGDRYKQRDVLLLDADVWDPQHRRRDLQSGNATKLVGFPREELVEPILRAELNSRSNNDNNKSMDVNGQTSCCT